MHFCRIALLLLIVGSFATCSKMPPNSVLMYVDPLIGSGGQHITEYGGTQPMVGPPFAMTNWIAMTRLNKIGRCSYHFDDSSFYGIIGSHQPTVWMGDYGPMAMMPGIRQANYEFYKRKWKLLKESESAHPQEYTGVIERDFSENRILVYQVKNNTQGETISHFATVKGKKFRIQFSDPENSTNPDPACRVYEIELFGPAGKIDVQKLAVISCSAEMNNAERVEFAFDGKETTKWCAPGKGNWIDLEFSSELEISGWRIAHAEAGGESQSYNSRNFELFKYREALHDIQQIKLRFTATEHSSIVQFEFPDHELPHIVIDAGFPDPDQFTGAIRMDNKHSLSAKNSDRYSAYLGPVLKHFAAYFHFETSIDFDSCQFFSDNKNYLNIQEISGNRCGVILYFPPGTRQLSVKSGSSFISREQAITNLKVEIPEWNYDKVKEQTRDAWVRELNRIKVFGADDSAKTIFYTAMYHSLLFPRNCSEYGRYYSAFDDSIHNGTAYNDFSLWDIFRAQIPLLNLLSPGRSGEMMQSLINMFEEGAWLPKWPNPGYTGIMIGSPAEAVLAEAVMKDIPGFDYSKAYSACRKSATKAQALDTLRRWADRDSNGSFPETRGGLSYYMDMGYVPCDKTSESVSRTIEFSYDDYCLALMAGKLNLKEDSIYFLHRSKSFKNVYHEGFVLARTSEGNWRDDPKAFTEGSPWTYQFGAIHDVPGMIEVMGGKDRFINLLDENFTEGHYRHDNEPGHHYAYLYLQVGQPWKTQRLVRKILKTEYKAAPDGYSGNDDCGQMSAWYILSSMGFYPANPVSAKYQLGSPIWDRVIIELPENKTLEIVCHNQSSQNVYVRKIKWNGMVLDGFEISHKELMMGGTMEFFMDDKVNESE